MPKDIFEGKRELFRGLLIDEYDKLILDNIENIPEALVIRDGMRDFYTKIKENDRYLIGIVFDPKQRNVSRFEVERV